MLFLIFFRGGGGWFKGRGSEEQLRGRDLQASKQIFYVFSEVTNLLPSFSARFKQRIPCEQSLFDTQGKQRTIYSLKRSAITNFWHGLPVA